MELGVEEECGVCNLGIKQDGSPQCIIALAVIRGVAD